MSYIRWWPRGQEKKASISSATEPFLSFYFLSSPFILFPSPAQLLQTKFYVLHQMVTRRPGNESYRSSISEFHLQLNYSKQNQIVNKRPGNEGIKYHLPQIFFNQSTHLWIPSSAQLQQIKFDVLNQMVTKRPGKEGIKYHLLQISFNQSIHFWLPSPAQLQQTKFDVLHQMVTKRPGKEGIKYHLPRNISNQRSSFFFSYFLFRLFSQTTAKIDLSTDWLGYLQETRQFSQDRQNNYRHFPSDSTAEKKADKRQSKQAC